jgi:hypothetical protein
MSLFTPRNWDIVFLNQFEEALSAQSDLSRRFCSIVLKPRQGLIQKSFLEIRLGSEIIV